MRVGLVQYLNALPFHISLDINDLKLEFAHPTTLNHRLAMRKLDAALTSSIAYCEDSYTMLPLGIAAKGAVLSVNLYTRNPLSDDTRVALPWESATSVTLLKILCHHFWRIAPHFVTEKEEHDAILLIGDKALTNMELAGYSRIDLGEAWEKETGLPFIFALLMAHKDLPHDSVVRLEKALEHSLGWHEKNHKAFLDIVCKRSSLSRDLLSRYFHALHYRLDEKDREGFQLFSTLAKSLDVSPLPA